MFLENVYTGKTLMDNAMIFHWKFKKIRKNLILFITKDAKMSEWRIFLKDLKDL